MSRLREFVERVDRSRERSAPHTKTIAVPKDLLIIARDHIAGYVERSAEGGRRGRGHRYQNIPEDQLSQSPRAIRERKRRRQKARGAS